MLALGLVFRMWSVSSARFTGDESDYWYKSRQVVVGGYRPAYGPEITGSAARLPGPAYYYLMAAPQAIGPSPRWGSAFVALLHVWTAVLLVVMVGRLQGPRAALIAAMLVAFAPWDILYGDRIWGSCVVPVWGSIAVFATIRSRSSPAWLGVTAFLALTLPQLHLSVPVLWVTCAVLVALRPPPYWPRLALALGLTAAIFAYFPPLFAELRSGFANTQRILDHSTGNASIEEALTAPVKVFAYAVLYASSEIGYHWARGYWGGTFSEATAYFTVRGLQAWWHQHGTFLAIGHIVSVATAIIGWSVALRAVMLSLRRRGREPLDAATVLVVGLMSGLAVGAVLIALARKTYFPHYANILMPMLLAPVAFGLDLLAKRSARWQAGVLAAVACSAATMAVGTARYYRQIDSLNGLTATTTMVNRILEEPGPVQLRFQHFNNAFAWGRIAEGLYDRSLSVATGAPVAFTVRNRAPHTGPIPDGGSLHGSVLLTRSPAHGRTMRSTSVPWRSVRVETTRDGRTVACRPEASRCRYGPHPWQKLEPTVMTVAGQPQPLLFMHPIEGAAVRARIPVPAKQDGGTLLFALSDEATQSTNHAPVDVTLLDGRGQVIGRARAQNRPGLRRLRFKIERGPLVVEIRTEREGARVFGFDVQWPPP